MELGRLTQLSIRDVWKTESLDFTPWLAQELEQLGDAIGCSLELIKTEQEVGDFFLDILARHPDGRAVVIENQFGESDHKHLGQLLTYAAGQEAQTIIWICERFRDEHRKALELLNERTHEGTSFFGIEIKAVTTDGNTAAPLFQVVVCPNEWFKKQKAKTSGETGLQPAQKRKNEFYQNVLAHILSNKPHLTNKRSTKDIDYLDFNTGKSGYRYWIQFRGGRLSCQVVFHDGSSDKVVAKRENKRRFDEMQRMHASSIEERVPLLSWERLDESKISKAVLYCPFSDEEQMITWASDTLEKFHKTFPHYFVK
jgi:hypothetical protein